MNILKKCFLYLIGTISIILTILALLSLIHDVSYWYTKVLDFPRIQYLIVGIVCLILFLTLNRKWSSLPISVVVGLVLSIIIQSTFIFPYYLGAKTVADAVPDKENDNNTVGILIANVLITNRHASAFSAIVKKRNPDMLLVMEVDKWWIKELAFLKGKYPYSIELPLDNAYGMALYSKFPLKDKEIKYLNKKDVPSFHTKVIFPTGSSFVFHGVHPVAPVPSDKYPDNEGEKEIALHEVGEIIKKESTPVIVAGDLNDVSWSKTSRFFENNVQLNNVRIGRGVYNTFNAKSFLMRWPLDHFFVSDEFTLIALERLPKFGSDHFPIYCKLALNSPK